MNKPSHIFSALLFTFLLLVSPALGQDEPSPIEPLDGALVNPQAHISFPPPVYVISGSVDIYGTVTLDNMLNFYLEYRELDLGPPMSDDEGREDTAWYPATVPRLSPVDDDLLGTWNTIILRDAIYELRLIVNTSEGSPEYYRVSPIRLENDLSTDDTDDDMDDMDDDMDDMDDSIDEPEPTVEEVNEPEPEEPAFSDDTPRVTALVGSNVRAGDSTSYQIIGGLAEGESAIVRGISSYNTGWYYIELPSGRTGFIHPAIVRASTDLSDLPRITPPPLPPTPIPIPTSTPIPAAPVTGADLIMTEISTSPHPAVCGEAYTITATVRNIGSGSANSGGLIEVRDARHDGAGLETTTIAFRQLEAGGSQKVKGKLTQSRYFAELHHITVVLDSANQVAETNENNNLHATSPYILAKGKCG